MRPKYILVIGCLLYHFASFAQDSTTNKRSSLESSVALRAGVNFANVSIADNGNIDDAKMLTTFQVGLLADFPIVSFFSIQSGLFFTGKGSKTQSGDPQDANYYRATTNPYYVELPLNAVFKIPMDGTKFFIGAGPYVAMGVAGKRKMEGRFLGVSYNSKEKIAFSNDDPTTNEEEGAGFGIIRRFDYGFNGTVGFEGKSAIISANYGLGLAKLQSGTTNGADNNNKHRVFSITVGVKL